MADVAELGLAVDSGPVKAAVAALGQFSSASQAAAKSADDLTAASGRSEGSIRAMESAAKRAGITVAEFQARTDAFKAGTDRMAAASSGAAQTVARLTSAQQITGSTFLRTATSYNTVSLALQGISAAATAYFALTADKGPNVEDTLQEQARLVGLVKDAYRDATDKAGTFYSQSKAIVQLQTELNINNLQSNIRSQIGDALRSSVGMTSNVDILGNSLGTGALDIAKKLEPFRSAIEDLSGSAGLGAPAIERYRDAVAGIGNANPALKAIAGELLAASQAAGETADKLEAARRAQRILNGTATPDDRAGLGLSNKIAAPPRDPFDTQVTSINKHIAAMKADAAAVDGTVGEHARLRTEAQLLEAAQQKGNTATAAQVAKLKELGQAAADAAMLLERAKVNSDIKFSTQTAFLTPAELQIAQQLKGLYGSDIPAALASTEAAGLRAANSLKQISDAGQDVTRGIFVDFTTGIRNGTSAFQSLQNAGVNALGKISDKLASMAADNLWKAAFGGTSGNIFSSLFGGASGAVNANGSISGAVGPTSVGGAPLVGFAAADGGTFGPGWGVVGERGPELINVHNRGVTVIPNHISRPFLPGFAEGGMLSAGGNVTRLPFDQNNMPAFQAGDTHITIQGSADKETVALMRRELAKRDAAFADNVVKTVKAARSGRHL